MQPAGGHQGISFSTNRKGLHGGYQLARSFDEISILEVVDAIEGSTPLFACREIRCPLFKGKPPAWVTQEVCGILGLARISHRI